MPNVKKMLIVFEKLAIALVCGVVSEKIVLFFRQCYPESNFWSYFPGKVLSILIIFSAIALLFGLIQILKARKSPHLLFVFYNEANIVMSFMIAILTYLVVRPDNEMRIISLSVDALIILVMFIYNFEYLGLDDSDKAANNKKPKKGGNNCLDDSVVTHKNYLFKDYQTISDNIGKILEGDDIGSKNFSIALAGEWGSGKSSIVETICSEKTKYCIEIIRLQPNVFETRTELIENFFAQLCRILDNNFIQTDKYSTMRNYERAILGFAAKRSDKVITENLFPHLHEQAKTYMVADYKRRKGELQHAVNNLCDKGNIKRIVVFVDDMERLDEEKQTELFWFILELASFDNFAAVFTLDNGEMYKETFSKFIQLNIPMPPLNPNDVIDGICNSNSKNNQNLDGINDSMKSEDLKDIAHLLEIQQDALCREPRNDTAYNRVMSNPRKVKHLFARVYWLRLFYDKASVKILVQVAFIQLYCAEFYENIVKHESEFPGFQDISNKFEMNYTDLRKIFLT
ncbi:hypothetical protein AGMMS49975_15800 [Clostridia bacterium]|nr:hypothetical protein AGMMS49975_15800 [Clostridia bacterium]